MSDAEKTKVLTESLNNNEVHEVDGIKVKHILTADQFEAFRKARTLEDLLKIGIR